MIVLDTNVISEVMRPAPEARVLEWLRRHPLNMMATTAVTVAEIRYGLGRLPEGKRRQELSDRFRMFLETGFHDRILAFDAEVAEMYGIIVVDREKAGRKIDAFDAMIAATARTHGAAVATRDVSGFDGCGIEFINPWDDPG